MITKDADWTKLTVLYEAEPVRAYALALHYMAIEGFSGFSDELNNLFEVSSHLGSKTLVRLYTEYLTLFMHLTARQSDFLFGPEGATLIQRSLLPFITEYAMAYYQGSGLQVAETLMEAANDAETVYASCKYWINAKETDSIAAYKDPSSTLVQFYLRLSMALEINYSDPLERIKVITSGSSGTNLFFTLIELDQWLRGPAMSLGIKNFKSIDLKPPGLK